MAMTQSDIVATSSTKRHASRLFQFWNDTSGAVTVDWVVLTAAVVGMVIAFMAGFTEATDGFLVDLMAALV